MYLKIYKNSPSSTHNYFNTKGIKYLTRLRIGLSHLREHKFKHGFLDSLNPICNCELNIETTCHFLLHCPNFINERLYQEQQEYISRITKDDLPSSKNASVKLLLYGDDSFDSAKKNTFDKKKDLLLHFYRIFLILFL